jgi:hypothetical protein
MSDQTGNTVTSTDPAQIAGTIKRMKPGVSHSTAIPDVVQPRRNYQDTVTKPERLNNTLCAAANAPNVPPADRQLGQMPPGKRLRISDRYHGSERKCYHDTVTPSPVRNLSVPVPTLTST